MGHQIEAGDRGIYHSDGSQLVVNWCEAFSPRTKPVDMSDREWFEAECGSTNISAESAKVANEKVPIDYATAKSAGLLDGLYRHNITEGEFIECREFLRYAAENGIAITGSY